ncbi:hypothetical protein FRC07_014410, partial [Ceratobasidium sp. 392]
GASSPELASPPTDDPNTPSPYKQHNVSAKRVVDEPTTPPHIFHSRTSLASQSSVIRGQSPVSSTLSSVHDSASSTLRSTLSPSPSVSSTESERFVDHMINHTTSTAPSP